ncbi:TPA: LPXTG cell wall anchor domain-containing protein, partial [Staphylococcus aureus]|nr:LPXTG cell wall anchor domain-containing protein [Staphylococcus aureus]
AANEALSPQTEAVQTEAVQTEDAQTTNVKTLPDTGESNNATLFGGLFSAIGLSLLAFSRRFK